MQNSKIKIRNDPRSQLTSYFIVGHFLLHEHFKASQNTISPHHNATAAISRAFNPTNDELKSFSDVSSAGQWVRDDRYLVEASFREMRTLSGSKCSIRKKLRTFIHRIRYVMSITPTLIISKGSVCTR